MRAPTIETSWSPCAVGDIGCIEGSGLTGNVDSSPEAILTKATILSFSDAEDIIDSESSMVAGLTENGMVFLFFLDEMEGLINVNPVTGLNPLTGLGLRTQC